MSTRSNRIIELLRLRGMMKASEVRQELGISQPTMSRLIRDAGSTIVRLGRSVAISYALPREIRGLGRSIPVFRVDENGRAHRHGELLLLTKDQHWRVWPSDTGELFQGLPPFVNDMRPQGYLGNGFATRFPEINLPPRLRDWNDDHFLLAMATRGEDVIGNLIIGEESFERFMASRTASFSRSDYPQLAIGSLTSQPGSSAGGEQPKFVVESEGRHVLVKFAGGDGEAAERQRDLLIAEALASDVLSDAGMSAARSSWFDLDSYRFLEVERFDRVGSRGRRGVISLEQINAHFLDPRFDGWGQAGRRIMTSPALRMDSRHVEQMIWLDTFGDLIANSDRHFGNFSFFADEAKTYELTPTPVYDMLPMLFMPQNGNVVMKTFSPKPPTALNFDIWPNVAKVARDYWERLMMHHAISEKFRRIANQCRDTLSRLMDQFEG